MALPSTSVRLDPRLVESARSAARLPPDTPLTALLRLALAKLAGWSDDAATVTARLPKDTRPAGPPAGPG